MKDLFNVVKRSCLTEKGNRLQETENKVVFAVDPRANKIEIKSAVETQFGVHVLAVRTQNYKGALRTLRNRRVVRDSGWKRAIVTVKAGERIETV